MSNARPLEGAILYGNGPTIRHDPTGDFAAFLRRQGQLAVSVPIPPVGRTTERTAPATESPATPQQER